MVKISGERLAYLAIFGPVIAGIVWGMVQPVLPKVEVSQANTNDSSIVFGLLQMFNKRSLPTSEPGINGSLSMPILPDPNQVLIVPGPGVDAFASSARVVTPTPIVEYPKP